MTPASVFHDIKTNYGNIASVVGLIVTYLVYRDVGKLRRHYTFLGRSDELTDRLRRHATELTDCLNDFAGSSDRAMSQLILMRATLEALEQIIAKPHKKVVKHLLRRTRRYGIDSGLLGDLPWTRANWGEQGLRVIYNDLLYVTQKTIDVQENSKYE